MFHLDLAQNIDLRCTTVSQKLFSIAFRKTINSFLPQNVIKFNSIKS